MNFDYSLNYADNKYNFNNNLKINDIVQILTVFLKNEIIWTKYCNNIKYCKKKKKKNKYKQLYTFTKCSFIT